MPDQDKCSKFGLVKGSPGCCKLAKYPGEIHIGLKTFQSVATVGPQWVYAPVMAKLIRQPAKGSWIIAATMERLLKLLNGNSG